MDLTEDTTSIYFKNIKHKDNNEIAVLMGLHITRFLWSKTKTKAFVQNLQKFLLENKKV